MFLEVPLFLDKMFYCQRESYSRELETEVISCSASSRQLDTAGRKVGVYSRELDISCSATSRQLDTVGRKVGVYGRKLVKESKYILSII